MLEFNNWYFVMLANFLVLLYVLNILLFKPILKVFKEREEALDGSLKKAKDMQNEKDGLLEEIQKGFTDASVKAKAGYEEKRGEGLKGQKEALAEAAKKASEALEKARAELKAEADKARESLKADVDKFSEEIVNKLVGA
jgi:F-type H+-transporting ATPase subunit b